ncbi:MAG TPA: acyl carrier protein [Verrucomicrobiae bacterium]|nr:acyl carrier protein [Verrucomicrobiae bacterium]
MKKCTTENVKEFLLRKYSSALASRSLAPEVISDNFDLLGEGIIDSLGVLDMIGDVEREFSIQLDMEHIDAEEFTIIGPFCRYVAQNAKDMPA